MHHTNGPGSAMKQMHFSRRCVNKIEGLMQEPIIMLLFLPIAVLFVDVQKSPDLQIHQRLGLGLADLVQICQSSLGIMTAQLLTGMGVTRLPIL
jgi:hypothetical protein